MSSNNVGHLITKSIITLQHFATLHYTSLNYASLHLSKLHFLSFTLHCPLIWLNTLTISYCSFSPHITKLYTVQLTVKISKLISKIMNLFTTLKNLSPFHFTSIHFLLFIYFFFTYPINPSFHFTLLFLSTTHFPLLFAFYRLYFLSLVFTFLTLVLKICVLTLEVTIAASGSLFQSVMDLFTKKYFPMSVLCFLTLILQ